MSELVADCPRCGAGKITFDVLADKLRWVEHDWLHVFESFSVCRACRKSTVFVLHQREYDHRQFFANEGPSSVKGGLSGWVEEKGYISLKDAARVAPPEYLPKNIENIFNEGASCAATVQALATFASTAPGIDLDPPP